MPTYLNFIYILSTLLTVILGLRTSAPLQSRQMIRQKSVSDSKRATRIGARIDSDEFEVIATWKVNVERLRIDNFLVQADEVRFPSPTAAKRALRKGLITINSRITKKIDADVIDGDLVEYHVRVSRLSYKPDSIQNNLTKLDLLEVAEVLYENDFFAIIRKPAGCTFDDMNSIALHTLSPPSRSHIKEVLRRPSVVHRLDRPVAGVLLIAKTAPSLRCLSSLFAEREIKKEYMALVAGKVGEVGMFRTINIPLGDREACTTIQVYRVDPCRASHDGCVTTLKIYPKTGRNHQIRKHLSYSGHPIIGDTRYWFKHAKPDQEERRREEHWRKAHNYICDLKLGHFGDDTKCEAHREECIALVSTYLEFEIPAGSDAAVLGDDVVVKVETEPKEVETIRCKLFEYCNSVEY